MPYSGGEEVLLDVGGQDGSEAFEDVGHSDEAREILDGLLVGNVKRMVCIHLKPPLSALSTYTELFPTTNSIQPGDPEPKSHATTTASSSSSNSNSAGFGVGLYAIILIGGAIAYGAYNYLEAQKSAQ